MSEAYVYIAECADGSFYTGWTTNPDRRLREHNAGRGARYTRSRRPLELAYIETHPDRASAMKRERALKKYSHAQKRALVDQQQNTPTQSAA